jgi:colanic acid/amylovoran biosynthesis glycosyltransferase
MTRNKPRLRIGYVVKMFPRISETFILNEILELERRGVKIVVFSIKKPNEGRFHPQLSKLKAKVFYLEDLEPKKWVTWLGKVWPYACSRRDEFWRLVEDTLVRKDQGRMDLMLQSAWVGVRAMEFGLTRLHAHFASLPSTVAYFAHLITGIPFSFTAHAKDIYVYDMEQHLLKEKLLAAQFVVTVTHYNRNFLIENAPELDPAVIRVIHNGVDTGKLNPDGRRRREPNQILAVGRLVPKKGFGDLLDACRILKNRGISFKCLIAGDGLEAESLRRKQQELDLADDVEFLGSKNQTEVLKLMRKATLLCLPCTVDDDGNRDALPTVILEAMACGLPVVSTNISGIPEMVDSDVDGVLVEPDNPAALSDQLIRLLSSSRLRRKFASSGLKKVASKFNLQKNVDYLLKLYLENESAEDASASVEKQES